MTQGWAATANLMVARRAFDAVGGFDPAYHYGEDVDFCLRAGRSGYELRFCAAALVFHEAERELRPVVRRAFNHGYGAAQVMRRLGVGHVAWRREAHGIAVGIDDGGERAAVEREVAAIGRVLPRRALRQGRAERLDQPLGPGRAGGPGSRPDGLPAPRFPVDGQEPDLSQMPAVRKITSPKKYGK